MVSVTFVDADGGKRHVEAQPGQSVMEAAIANGIDQILADCGGALSCATCHVHVARDWIERVGPAAGDELLMLDMAIEPDETSRLSCQIRLSEDLDGLELRLPASQM